MKGHYNVLLEPKITEPDLKLSFAFHRRQLKVRRNIPYIQCHAFDPPNEITPRETTGIFWISLKPYRINMALTIAGRFAS
jgi:hypothetical protein